MGEREVDVAVKGQQEGSRGDESVLSLLYHHRYPSCDNVLEFCKLFPLGDSR